MWRELDGQSLKNHPLYRMYICHKYGYCLAIINEILEEYKSVLSRPKFHLNLSLIETVIKAIITDGLNIDRTPAADIEFPDPKDIVF